MYLINFFILYLLLDKLWQRIDQYQLFVFLHYIKKRGKNYGNDIKRAYPVYICTQRA